ncbi:hypothetical protein HY638_02520 [Candidatus Woesearchaeota archaeon]|nr:hypothetical protein [Candidatus Woesearchaeota archaeon]
MSEYSLKKADFVEMCINPKCRAVKLLGNLYRLPAEDQWVPEKDPAIDLSTKCFEGGCGLTSKEVSCKADPVKLNEFYSVLYRDIPPILLAVSDNIADLERVEKIGLKHGFVIYQLCTDERVKREGAEDVLRGVKYVSPGDIERKIPTQFLCGVITDWQLTPNGTSNEGEGVVQRVINLVPPGHTAMWSKRQLAAIESLRQRGLGRVPCFTKEGEESDRQVQAWLWRLLSEGDAARDIAQYNTP